MLSKRAFARRWACNHQALFVHCEDVKFAYTILYVPDVTRAIEFYENAFGLQRRFIHESGEYAELSTGETTLSFASLTLAPSNVEGGVTPNDPGNGIVLSSSFTSPHWAAKQ